MIDDYAAALYDLAVKRGALDDFAAQAASIKAALMAGENRASLLHPYVSSADKRDFVEDALPEGIDDDLVGFLHMLIAKRQADLILPSLSGFTAMLDKPAETALAYVSCAEPLTLEQTTTLERALSGKLGKPVEISLSVEPSLIGGLTIYVDGYIIERTVKRQLTDMRDAIKREVPHAH